MATKKTLIGNVPIKEMKQEVSDYIAEAKEGNALLTETFSVEDNPEFVETKTDSDGKLIESTGPEGEKTFYGDVEVKGTFKNSPLTEQITEATENKVDKEEGKSLIDENVAAMQSVEDNPEYMDVKTDSNGKVIAYRDNDGYLNENVGIKTKTLKAESYDYSDDNLSDLAKALKSEYIVNATDWSDYISNDGDNPLQLPMPQCAIINFTGIDSLPTKKNVNYQAYMEYWDKMGNYFKKKVMLNGQGSSSLYWNAEKNIAIDMFDSDWNGDAFAIRFGQWVPQDSYHDKAFYTDPIRGLADVCYKYADYLIRETDTRPNRLAREEGKVTTQGDTGTFNNDFDTGALCHPDGFPNIVYVNGEFYGIMAFNLKKHRDNYMMSKKDYESVHIDSDSLNLWADSDFEWTNVEVRNPKSLVCMDGTDYDGDNPKELIDSTSESYDSTNKAHIGTAKTKAIILAFHTSVKDINALSTTEEKKAKFESLFDVDGMITFWITSQLYDNWDGLQGRNTQWIYYSKSGKWCPTLYDLDNCIGYFNGPYLRAPLTTIIQNNTTTPCGLLWNLYKTEICSKYAELRKSGAISTDKFMEIYDEWYKSIPSSLIEENAKKWECPCYRDGKVNSTYWKQVNISSEEDTYDSTKTYSVGDTVNYGYSASNWGKKSIVYECVKECTGEAPAEAYDLIPYYGGAFDSPRRVELWLKTKIGILDGSDIFNYTE